MTLRMGMPARPPTSSRDTAISSWSRLSVLLLSEWTEAVRGSSLGPASTIRARAYSANPWVLVGQRQPDQHRCRISLGDALDGHDPRVGIRVAAFPAQDLLTLTSSPQGEGAQGVGPDPIVLVARAVVHRREDLAPIGALGAIE